VVDAGADTAVKDAAQGFTGDLARVGGASAGVVRTSLATGAPAVVIGVLGQSPLIGGLVKAGRIRATDIAGRWEAYRQIVVDRPFPGVPQALIIVGADRRGAVFGTYDLSERIGVSPWSWWADVPVAHRSDLWIAKGDRTDAPRVRYRGIFINDEEPAFGTWARTHFGGINAKMYAHVFDLILRLKGNYLWPAMWGKSIAADDPASMPLADAKGLVLGTSHHEPMTRAQSEWHRAPTPGQTSAWDRQGNRIASPSGAAKDAVIGGKWDYLTNAQNLRAFWRGGIERMMTAGSRGQPMEQLVTVGMRGDGDEPMSEGTATHLLERIVADQRTIIADVTGRPASATPQVWALYKEVQDYYDQGMKVPDDVTLLFSDDNWGQIRRLPTGDRDRSGGYGIYYHFDYVGGPRSYKWLANTQVQKTWQQLDLAYRRGVKQLWVVNVGDVKPMEMPIDFFMKMAWNPDAMTPEALAAYPETWGRALFGPAHGGQIGRIADDYARLAARRKPELVDADSFPLGGLSADRLDGGEFGRMVAAWTALEQRMLAMRDRLRPDQRDAYLQLVEHPVAAMANLYRLYYAVAWNRRLAAADDPRANGFADQAEAAFRRDRDLTEAYHHAHDGKWDGMMLQTKFGYTSWSDPKTDQMPQVKRVSRADGRPTASIGAAAAPASSPTAPTGHYAVAEAGAFVRARGRADLGWRVIPHLGRTDGAIISYPQGRPATTTADGVRADYAMTLKQAGDATLRLYMVPALDTNGGKGLRIGVSIDGAPVQILTMNLKVDGPEWTRAVKDNAFPLEAKFPSLAAGTHRIAIWRIDDNMAVQRLLLFTGAIPPSYLGPDAP
jgi:hypothetical protein